jgi:hypothetical protein
MDSIQLSPTQKEMCRKDKFCSFVLKNEDFTVEEAEYLQGLILNRKLSKILYLSATLAVWSMIAAWVDAVILPFIIIYVVALPGAQYYALLFPIVWTVLNAFFKFLYIRNQLGDAVSIRDSLLAVFPYAGAAFLLKNWFVGDQLLRKASLAYIAHQKKLVVGRIKRVFKGRQ